jgi:hypothetical protein
MNPGRADSGAIHTEHMSRERDPEMSTAYGTLDQAAPSAHPHAQQPLADRSGQQPGGWSPYVGLHRRRDGQGLDPDDAQHRPGHRPRHRRP